MQRIQKKSSSRKVVSLSLAAATFAGTQATGEIFANQHTQSSEDVTDTAQSADSSFTKSLSSSGKSKSGSSCGLPHSSDSKNSLDNIRLFNSAKYMVVPKNSSASSSFSKKVDAVQALAALTDKATVDNQQSSIVAQPVRVVHQQFPSTITQQAQGVYPVYPGSQQIQYVAQAQACVQIPARPQVVFAQPQIAQQTQPQVVQQTQPQVVQQIQPQVVQQIQPQVVQQIQPQVVPQIQPQVVKQPNAVITAHSQTPQVVYAQATAQVYPNQVAPTPVQQNAVTTSPVVSLHDQPATVGKQPKVDTTTLSQYDTKELVDRLTSLMEKKSRSSKSKSRSRRFSSKVENYKEGSVVSVRRRSRGSRSKHSSSKGTERCGSRKPTVERQPIEHEIHYNDTIRLQPRVYKASDLQIRATAVPHGQQPVHQAPAKQEMLNVEFQSYQANEVSRGGSQESVPWTSTGSLDRYRQ